jgi:hypothetical protein
MAREMPTDEIPSHRITACEYKESETCNCLRVPPSRALAQVFQQIRDAIKTESVSGLERTAQKFLQSVSSFYQVSVPDVRILDVRPHKTFDGLLVSELFGDYNVKSHRVRLWTRTPIKRQWTTPETVLVTLCHEFVHHLDITLLGFPNSFHTEGFYQRTHRLYLSALRRRYYPLVWYTEGRHVIDWPATKQSEKRASARKKRPRR